MKKLTALFLAALLLLPAALQISAEAFTFQNGIQWGMTPEEVGVLEPEESLRDRRGPLLMVICPARRVSKFQAEVQYLYSEEKLCALLYGEFTGTDETAADYLEGALSLLYGEAEELSQEEFDRIMSPMGEWGTTIAHGRCWQAADDTVVWLFTAYDEPYVVYREASFDPAGLLEYDITGL